MTRLHRNLAGIVMVLAFGALAAGQPEPTISHPSALARDITAQRDHISALELARWIRAGADHVHVFDLRPPAAFDELHIPTARNIALTDLVSTALPRTARIVVYADGAAHAAQAWVLLRARGYHNVWFLREGIYEWVARVLEPRLATDATTAETAAYEQAVPLSRYFGGMPRRNVARAEVPTGYWTEIPDHTHAPQRSDVSRQFRRRGC